VAIPKWSELHVSDNRGKEEKLVWKNIIELVWKKLKTIIKCVLPMVEQKENTFYDCITSSRERILSQKSVAKTCNFILDEYNTDR
jgi:hypothetical protein